jgi:rRNA-processing protein EBP2
MGKKTPQRRKGRVEPAPVERYEDAVDSDEERIVAESARAAESDDDNQAGAAETTEAKEEVVKRTTVYDVEGMEQRTEDLELGLPFVETFVVATAPVGDVNAEDDLKREVLFYRQALDAVKAGREKMEEAGVNHQRPEDYFAEMVKSDQHMARIKQRLLFEKQKMDAFEQRKKQQDYKKFAKQLQAEKLKEKSAKKKQAVKDAKELKGIVDESGGEILRSAAGAGGKRKREEREDRDDGARGQKRVGRKREAKNAKFGFGGKKG